MRLKEIYSSMSFRGKISSVMIIILLILCFSLSAIQVAFFYRLNRHDAIQSAEEWLAVSERSIRFEWDRIYSSVVEAISDMAFASSAQQAVYGIRNPLSIQVDMQDYLEMITTSSTIVQDAYIVLPDNSVLKAYEPIILDKTAGLFDFGSLENSHGISLGKEIISPFGRKEMVVPVIIQLGLLGWYVHITESNPDMIAVLLLSAEEIDGIINNTQSPFFSSDIHLEFGSEKILLKERPEGKTITLRTPASIPDLDIVMTVPTSSFVPNLLVMIGISFSVFASLALAGVLAVRKIAIILTAPFPKMMRMIERIKLDAYDISEEPRYHDETGRLITAINEMYGTIREQMERIRAEENQKYKYMSELLTEQINPHFIYNTLEAINMELLSGNSEAASMMISALGSFLRTTLNHGQDMIAVSDEVKNVEAYMEIMNHRLNRRIEFSASIHSQETGYAIIPKGILQPIVENSIKHGFSADSLIISPRINVEVSGDDRTIRIICRDNGTGIDTVKAENIIKATESKPHIGLRNISERLSLYYSDVSFSFTSFPYVENTVMITASGKKE